VNKLMERNPKRFADALATLQKWNEFRVTTARWRDIEVPVDELKNLAAVFLDEFDACVWARIVCTDPVRSHDLGLIAVKYTGKMKPRRFDE
jgi:hypothetical protein